MSDRKPSKGRNRAAGRARPGAGRPGTGRPGGGRQRASRPGSRQRVAVLAAVAGVVVLLAVIAVIATRDSDEDGAAAGAQTRPVQVTGAPLPVGDASTGTDPAVGRPAPELRGASFDGQPVAITHDGTPRIVVFLTHWCPHCQRELPVLTSWLREDKPEGVEVVGVSTAVNPQRPNYPPSAWLHDEAFPAPVLADNGEDAAAHGYGLTAFPYLVAIDADGNVATRISGEVPADELTRIANALTG